jgi:hypothetical protein
MIHYSCDLCKRVIDPHADTRHIVKIEVFTAIDDVQACGCDAVSEDEADHLESMHDLLERLDECAELETGRLDDADGDEPETRTLRFDLCDDCRRRFLKNPLGVKPGKQFDFSNN